MYEATYNEQEQLGETADLEVRNLRCGTTNSAPVARLYLVDLYPVLKKPPLQMMQIVSNLIKGYLGERTDLTPKVRQFIESLNKHVF